VELGAEFLHGEAEATRDIARAAGLLVQELPEGHAWASGGRWRPMRDFWMLVEGYHAAPVDEISAQSLAADPAEADPQANRQHRLPQGYDGILAWLRSGLAAERVMLRLGTPVLAVEWARGRVTVHARGVSGAPLPPFRARSAIVTLPVGVLKAGTAAAGAVRFDPPLDRKQRALAGIAESPVRKIVLRFQRAFWEEPDFVAARFRGRSSLRAPQYFHDPAAVFPTWWTTAPTPAPVLTGGAGRLGRPRLARRPVEPGRLHVPAGRARPRPGGPGPAARRHAVLRGRGHQPRGDGDRRRRHRRRGARRARGACAPARPASLAHHWHRPCSSGWRSPALGGAMPDPETLERAKQDAEEGKSPSTQAGEFVREEIHHVREGKHGARSTKQAIAIGLSKARRAGVKLPASKGSSQRTRKQAARDTAKGTRRQRPSASRGRATRKALKREGRKAASPASLARQARSSARRRTKADRSASARKAARTRKASR
jgi:flavin-dependent amine oxidoreductase/uncharacterized protein DUF6496